MWRFFQNLFRHARPWISKVEQEGETSFGVQFEYEWPDQAKSLSEAKTTPRIEEINPKQN